MTSSRPKDATTFFAGDRVDVIGAGGETRGTGEVVGVVAGYVRVRFDGESGWYEWPTEWCWLS